MQAEEQHSWANHEGDPTSGPGSGTSGHRELPGRVVLDGAQPLRLGAHLLVLRLVLQLQLAPQAAVPGRHLECAGHLLVHPQQLVLLALLEAGVGGVGQGQPPPTRAAPGPVSSPLRGPALGSRGLVLGEGVHTWPGAGAHAVVTC